MAASGHICRQNGTSFGLTQLDHQLNISDKFKDNPTLGLGGDAIALSNGQFMILKIAAIRPYLLTEQNYFSADTSRY